MSGAATGSAAVRGLGEIGGLKMSCDKSIYMPGNYTVSVTVFLSTVQLYSGQV